MIVIKKMGKKLTSEEIKEKSIELNNVKKLYEMQKETNQNLKQKNNKLSEENKELRNKLKLSEEKNEKLALQLEEKNRMLFKKSTREKLDIEPTSRRRNEKTRERTNDSYRKAIPEEYEVTDTISHKLHECTTC